MSVEKIKARDILVETFAILWWERKLLGILTPISVVLMLIWIWPTIEINIEIWKAIQNTDLQNIDAMSSIMSEYQAEIFQNTKQMLILLPFMAFLFILLAVIWSRASILGSAKIFEGGLRPLLIRTLKTLWRYICAVGWMLLSMLAFLPLWMILLPTMSLENITANQNPYEINPFDFFLQWQIILMYLTMFFIVGTIYFLSSFAIHGESRDFRLPIHTSFKATKGNRLRALGLIVILYLVFQGWLLVAQLTLIDWNVFDPTKLFPTESSLTLYLVLSGFGYVTSFLLGYALLTLGAIYASKLVPELRV